MNHPFHPYTLRLFSSVPKEQRTIGEADKIEPEVSKEKAMAFSRIACPYVDQCAMGDQNCIGAEPEIKEVRPGHQVACFKV